MTAAGVLRHGRAAAESLMVDTCLIQRQVGTTTDGAGRITPTYTEVYSGKCRVQSRNLQGGSPTSGQQRVDIFTSELQVPITVTGLKVNDVVEVTSTLDPDLNGRTFRVANLFHKTHATARRVPIEEITS